MNHREFMQIAIDEAKKGKGKVSPNPLVGCVLVKNKKIVAKGFHKKFGAPHAEVNACNQLENFEEVTLYVTLEPCAHTGKTPPCVDLILEKKIKKVVIGTLDPNPLVAGKSVAKLKAAGIEVLVGVKEKECKYLARFFLKRMVQKRPYVLLKIAESADGFVTVKKRRQTQITGVESQKKCHELRSCVDGIVVGAETIRVDDPSLTNRLADGKNPIRIVLSVSGNFSGTETVFTDNLAPIFVCVPNEKVEQLAQKFSHINFVGIQMKSATEFDMNHFLRTMEKLRVYSLLIEGGPKIWQWFEKNKAVDEIWKFVSKKNIQRGVVSGINIDSYESVAENFGNDTLYKTLLEPKLLVEKTVVTNLPTRFGKFKLHYFENNKDQKEHIALVMGDISKSDSVLVRLHSECLTGDIFSSVRCDCEDQLHGALEAIANNGSGVLLYLRQEGRGIGLKAKLQAYNLQDKGLDTQEANECLGFAPDERAYEIAQKMLENLGVKKIKLLTNNPAKISELVSANINVIKRVPHVFTRAENKNYLSTKKNKMGHLL